MRTSRIVEISGPARSRNAPPLEQTEELAHLAGLAKACGAGGAGGALSAAECVWLERAARVTSGEARAVREKMLAGEDPLGDAFLSIRPHRQRREDGAFYTGGAIRRSMLSWALRREPQRLIDPGCGSGRFAGDAVRERPQLDVVAIDADPLATLMTRALLSVLGARRARVLCGDYITAHIPRIAGKSAFVGNPPYVRHHDIATSVKRHIDTLAADAAVRRAGLAGLHVWFFVATYARHASPGDVGAFVTSAQWLDTTYGRVLRELLSGSMGGRSVLTFEAASSPFDAMTTAAIATFEIGAHNPTMVLGTTPSPSEAIELERIGHTVQTDRLRASSRWSQIAAGAANDLGRTIGSVFRVSRGQVTGANAFFVMSHHRARQLGIDAFCVPVVSAAREILTSGGVVRNGPMRRVALCVAPQLDLAGAPALARYIAAGEAAGLHLRYVPARRKPWYAVAYSRPPIVATYMARRPPYFAINPEGLGVLNIALGLFPRAPMSLETLRDTVERLNAAGPQFAGRGRTYHGGLQKFEPGDLAVLPFEELG